MRTLFCWTFFTTSGSVLVPGLCTCAETYISESDSDQQDNEPDDDFIVAPPAVTAAAPVIKQSPVVTVDETKAYWCGCLLRIYPDIVFHSKR